MPKEKSAGAIVFRKEDGRNYYLLLHYKSGHWEFPKGHIEDGEDEEKTVKREVEEETGIKDIRIIKGFKEWIKYFFRQSYDLKKEDKKKAPCLHTKRGQPRLGGENNEISPRYGVRAWIFKIVIFYLVETKTKEVKISFEHIGYKWLFYQEALKQLTYKNAKEILLKANDFIIKHN